MSMPSGRLSPREARRESILEAALEIVQRDGLEQLTMRRLAEKTGLQLPLIYRVIANKQALIDAMTERIVGLALHEVSQTARGWPEEASALATSLRTAMLTYRDGARIVGGSYVAQPNNISFADRLVGSIEQSGLQGKKALWGASTIFCYVLGEVLEQQSSSLHAVAELHEAELSSTYRHLYATPVDELINFDERFEFGLSTILAGLGRTAT